MRQIIRDMVTEILGKMPLAEQDSEIITVVGEPLKGKLNAPAYPTESEWMKDMQRQMDQLQTILEKHGLNPNFTDFDLDLDEEELFPLKYTFLNIKKYSSTDDPHLHLK